MATLESNPAVLQRFIATPSYFFVLLPQGPAVKHAAIEQSSSLGPGELEEVRATLSRGRAGKRSRGPYVRMTQVSEISIKKIRSLRVMIEIIEAQRSAYGSYIRLADEVASLI